MRHSADDFKIVHTRDADGSLYVIAQKDGSGPALTEADLAAMPDPDRPPERRLMQFVLADEGQHRDRPLRLRFDPCGFTWTLPLPVLWEAPAAFITTLERRRPGATPGTVGWHLVATAELTGSILGTVVWRAVQSTTINAVCAAIADPDPASEDTVTTGGEIVRVNFETNETACNPRARILRSWTEPCRPLPWWRAAWCLQVVRWVPVALGVVLVGLILAGR